MEKIIDVNFNFLDDTPIGRDPDSYSKTLQVYHQILWSKELPNKKFMELKAGSPNWDYLKWECFRFGSDSIINMYTHHKTWHMKNLLSQVEIKFKNENKNYQEFVKDYLAKSYTIGGSLIFPKNGVKYSINVARGRNYYIKDRIDLTMECIRRYYLYEESPLFEVLNKNKNFFDLFDNFENYIKFFHLQDLVSDNYKSIRFFLDFDHFESSGYPKDVEEWFKLYEKQMEFLKERNERIKNYMK